jgi:hypothetical protein
MLQGARSEYSVRFQVDDQYDSIATVGQTGKIIRLLVGIVLVAIAFVKLA